MSPQIKGAYIFFKSTDHDRYSTQDNTVQLSNQAVMVILMIILPQNTISTYSIIHTVYTYTYRKVWQYKVPRLIYRRSRGITAALM